MGNHVTRHAGVGCLCDHGGGITSNPSGINCPGDCSESVPVNTNVELTAIPDTGSVFLRWAEDCASSGGAAPDVCTIRMDQERSVQAIFEAIVPPPSNPQVNSVSPVTAMLNELTTFTVNGSNLTSGMGFWIHDCAGIESVAGGTSTQQQFRCTPSYTVGEKAGVIKDQPGGTLLYPFSINVPDIVRSVTTTPATVYPGVIQTVNWFSTNQAWYSSISMMQPAQYR